MSIQLDDLVARLRLDSSGVGTGLSSLNGSLSSVGAKATAAGKRMTLGMTTPIVGLGIASTNLAANFDKTMRLVAVATDGPSKALSDLAKKMGAETAFSASEAADAMLELAKGGMTAVQIEGGALAATMKLATAGGVELAEASTYIANSMAAFGLSAKDADSVTVALAGAANASSASVQSLGLGLSQAASSARNAGLSLQETTGILSLFDAAGLKGSDAGTSLKSALNSLIPTTTKARGAMNDYNLDFVKNNGNFEDAATIAEQLKRGLGDLGEAQRTQALETIFGSDGMRAATVLMNGGREAVEKYTKASRDQETTTKLANAAMEGTAGAMERARGSIETAGLAIGQVLAPHVERAAAKVEELANKFTALSPETQGMIVKGLALAAVVGPLTLGLGFLATSLSGIIGATASASRALGLLAPVVGSTTTRLGALTLTAQRAAGVGGLLLLANGLKTAKDEGATFGGVMQGVAGGAGIGAMFGPIGALVGAGVGGGLTLLASSFHKTAEEAEATRIQLAESAGFAAAKADADTLSEALIGVVNAYGRVPRAAVAASFVGEDGKLDADIQKLRDLGLSMDTIVSATLGQASAQDVVNRALEGSIQPYRDKEAAARASLEAAWESISGGGATAGRASVAIEDYEKALERAKNELKNAEVAANVFRKRVDATNGAVVDHIRDVRALAEKLGLTREQYLKLPKNVRTKIEADGLPQTIEDAVRLIGEFKGLQNFKSIRAVIEATDAPLTIQQIETLKKRYDLTPKQVKTLIKADGIEAETTKTRVYNRGLEGIPARVSTEVHTSYTYSGRPGTAAGRGGGTGVSGRKLLDGDGGKSAQQSGYDYAAETMEGMTLGFRTAADATADEAGKTGDKAGAKLSDAAKAAIERRRKLLERTGALLSNDFAEGIVGGLGVVTRKMKIVTDALEKVGNDSALRLAATAGKALRKLGRQYDDLQKQLNNARTSLEAFEAARQTVVDRQTALGAVGGNLATLDFGSDVDGNPLAATADGVVAALTAVRDTAVNFDDTLAALRDAGLSQDALDQLIAAGPVAAAATADAILAGGATAIAQINALQANIASSGLSIQAKSSQTMFDVGVAAQQGLIAGLESQMGVLEEKMQDIARAMVKAIRKALKMRSPSRVMTGLGVNAGGSFAGGLDSTVRAVDAASTRLADAALIAPVVPITSATSAAARLASPAAAAAMSVRVFIGDRELTDIVRIEVGDTIAPLATAVRQGA